MLDEQTKSSGVYSEAELAARLDEGLKIQMIHELSGRTVGFIEYTPGEFAAENNITTKVVTFQTTGELLKNSPSPYGIFGLVLDGKLLSYHYLQRKDFDKISPS